MLGDLTRKKVVLIFEDDLEKVVCTFDSAEIKQFEQIDREGEEHSPLLQQGPLWGGADSMLIALVLDAVHKDNDTTKPLFTINVQSKVEQKIIIPPPVPAHIRNRLADEIKSWADTCLSNNALSPSYFNGLDDAEQIVRDGLEKWNE